MGQKEKVMWWKWKCGNTRGRMSSIDQHKLVLVFSVCQCLRDYIKYLVLNPPTANPTLNNHAYISNGCNKLLRPHCLTVYNVTFLPFITTMKIWHRKHKMGQNPRRMTGWYTSWANSPSQDLQYVESSRRTGIRAMWLHDVTSCS